MPGWGIYRAIVRVLSAAEGLGFPEGDTGGKSQLAGLLGWGDPKVRANRPGESVFQGKGDRCRSSGLPRRRPGNGPVPAGRLLTGLSGFAAGFRLYGLGRTHRFGQHRLRRCRKRARFPEWTTTPRAISTRMDPPSISVPGSGTATTKVAMTLAEDPAVYWPPLLE